MPKAKQPPDPTNRRQTRPGNANAHPGKVAMETLAVHRKQEVIDEEKKDRDERRQKRETKKAKEQVAILEIADFEDEMALDNIEEESHFPRRQTKGWCSHVDPIKRLKYTNNSLPLENPQRSKSKTKKRKEHVVSQKLPNSFQKMSELDDGDTDTELMGNDGQPLLKKQKKSDGDSMPLRRTG
jgi:hypothetical protein